MSTQPDLDRIEPDLVGLDLPDAAPDYFTPFYGWRLWAAVHDSEHGVWWLRSLVFDELWSPKEEKIARCRRNRFQRLVLRLVRDQQTPKGHQAPHEDCDCGVYAASYELLKPYLDSYTSPPPGKLMVIGRVKLWGTVVECERGWRAERAYPERLYVIPRRHLMRTLSREAFDASLSLDDYGVPVEVLGGMHEVKELLEDVDATTPLPYPQTS